MHAKFVRRGRHRRERDRIQGRSGSEGEDVAAQALKERQFGGDGQLTTPVTLTVTVFHNPGNTPIATETPDITITPTVTTFVTAAPTLPATISIPVGLTSTSDLPPTVTTTVLPPISTLSPSPTTVSTPPTTPSLSIISQSNASSIPNIPDNDSDKKTKNNPKLSTGATAGIIIGCLAVLIIAVLFGLRKRSAKRQSKLRGFWARSKGPIEFKREELEPTPYIYDPDSTINGQGLGSSMGFTGQPATMTGTGNGNTRTPTSPRSISTVGLGLPQGLPSAYGSEAGTHSTGWVSPSQMPVLYSTVVSRSFVPTLPDELSISTGETLKVLQEYDDGWAECMTLSGQVGMVPVECFDRRDSGRKSGRYSSLPGARR